MKTQKTDRHLAPMPGRGSWSASYKRACSLIEAMTLSELANVTIGYDHLSSCSGVSGSAPRLGFPGLGQVDAVNGIRMSDFVNAWPSSLHLGATWNKDLVRKSGKALAGEFKTKGANVLLGPVVGPLGRVAKSGRNWEGYSTDRRFSLSFTTQELEVVYLLGPIFVIVF